MIKPTRAVTAGGVRIMSCGGCPRSVRRSRTVSTATIIIREVRVILVRIGRRMDRGTGGPRVVSFVGRIASVVAMRELIPGPAYTGICSAPVIRIGGPIVITGRMISIWIPIGGMGFSWIVARRMISMSRRARIAVACRVCVCSPWTIRRSWVFHPGWTRRGSGQIAAVFWTKICAQPVDECKICCGLSICGLERKIDRETVQIVSHL